MLMVWLGAFTSLAVAAFSSYTSHLTRVGSAAGVLASLATCSLPWTDGTSDDMGTGWRIFAAVFCIVAVGLLSAYVSCSSKMF